MTKRVIDMVRSGDFNNMQQEWQTDGTVIITLVKHGDPHVYKVWVRDLYLPTEVVIKEETLPVV